MKRRFSIVLLARKVSLDRTASYYTLRLLSVQKNNLKYDTKNVEIASKHSLEDFYSIINYWNIKSGMIKVKSVVCKEITDFSDEQETNTKNYVCSWKNDQK